MRKYSIFLIYSIYYVFIGYNTAVTNVLFPLFLLITGGGLPSFLRSSSVFSMAIKPRPSYRFRIGVKCFALEG